MENVVSENSSWPAESRLDFSNPRERVRFVMNGASMCPRLFGELVGQPELCREVLAHNTPITQALADGILRRFPQIDPDWLLDGPKR